MNRVARDHLGYFSMKSLEGEIFSNFYGSINLLDLDSLNFPCIGVDGMVALFKYLKCKSYID